MPRCVTESKTVTSAPAMHVPETCQRPVELSETESGTSGGGSGRVGVRQEGVVARTARAARVDRGRRIGGHFSMRRATGRGEAVGRKPAAATIHGRDPRQ